MIDKKKWSPNGNESERIYRMLFHNCFLFRFLFRLLFSVWGRSRLIVPPPLPLPQCSSFISPQCFKLVSVVCAYYPRFHTFNWQKKNVSAIKIYKYFLLFCVVIWLILKRKYIGNAYSVYAIYRHWVIFEYYWEWKIRKMNIWKPQKKIWRSLFNFLLRFLTDSYWADVWKFCFRLFTYTE